MPQVIDVPKYGQIEFPDGMSDADIVKAIRNLPMKQPKAQLVDDPGVLKSVAIGAGRTVDRVLDGLTQMYLGARGEDSALKGLKENVGVKDEAYKPLQEAHPWATGIGEALPGMAIPVGGSATLLGNAGRMFLAGAIPSMLEYGTAGERLQRGAVNGVASAAMPIAGAAVKSAYSVAEPLFDRGRQAIAGRTLNRAAGENAPAVAARMGAAPQLVQGSLPTAAEVAESGGIAALQRWASAANPEAYTQRGMEQSSARLNALRGIAKDDAALASAEATRDAVARQDYGRAFAAGVDQDAADMLQPQIKDLLSRPSIKKAQMNATRLAKETGLNLNDAAGSVQGLHYIKLSLDDMIEKAGERGIGANEKRALVQTKQDLLSVMEDLSPGYKQAMERYAANSKPVNQMQIGQRLVDQLTPALSDFGALGRETGARYAQALRNADQTAKAATGMNGKGLADIMTPGQMQTLDAVGQDLARKANAQDLGRGVGSDTVQKLSMQNVAAQSGMPRLVGGLLDMPGLSRAVSWAYRETDQKMQSLLADALLDPAKAAALMQRADRKWLQDNPRVRQLLEQTAIRSGGALGMTSTSALAQPVE
jgi:hypothetical protein